MAPKFGTIYPNRVNRNIPTKMVVSKLDLFEEAREPNGLFEKRGA